MNDDYSALSLQVLTLVEMWKTLLPRHVSICQGGSQCFKGPFFVQKVQIFEKLEKWSISIFMSKLTIFSEMHLKFRA